MKNHDEDHQVFDESGSRGVAEGALTDRRRLLQVTGSFLVGGAAAYSAPRVVFAQTPGDLSPAPGSTCGVMTVLSLREGAGRPEESSEPNGFLTLPDEIVDFSGSNACTSEGLPKSVSVAGKQGSTVQEYEVQGENLEAVSDAIFDLEDGDGPLVEGGRRFAGKAEASFSPLWSIVAERPAPQSQKAVELDIQIVEFTWTTTICLPKWVVPDTAPQAQIDEWNRFRQALATHENGHAALNDAAFKNLSDALVNKPGGKITVTVAARPQFDNDGNPATDDDRKIVNEINDAVFGHVESQQGFKDLEKAQSAYDAAPTSENPGGTDHGRTQKAVLNTNP